MTARVRSEAPSIQGVPHADQHPKAPTTIAAPAETPAQVAPEGEESHDPGSCVRGSALDADASGLR